MSSKRMLKIELDISKLKLEEHSLGALLHAISDEAVGEVMKFKKYQTASSTFIEVDGLTASLFLDGSPLQTYSISVEGGSANEYSVEASSIEEALSKFKAGGLMLEYEVANEEGKIVAGGEFDLADEL